MAATQASYPRIEIVSDRRRAHDRAFRMLVALDAAAPGSRVREVANRHSVCTSLVYRWRRAATAAAAAPSLSLVPVRVVADPCGTTGSVVAEPAKAAPAARSIEIELGGGIRLRVDETISPAALRRVIGVLRG